MVGRTPPHPLQKQQQQQQPPHRTLGLIFLLALFLFEVAYVSIRLSIDSQRFTVTLPTTIVIAIILLVALFGGWFPSVRRFVLVWFVPVWLFAGISMSTGIILLLGANPEELFDSDFVHNHGITPGAALAAVMISHVGPLIAVILYVAEARVLARTAYAVNARSRGLGMFLYYVYTILLFPGIVAVVAATHTVNLGDIYPLSGEHLNTALFLVVIAATTFYGAVLYVLWALGPAILYTVAAASPRTDMASVKKSSS